MTTIEKKLITIGARIDWQRLYSDVRLGFGSDYQCDPDAWRWIQGNLFNYIEVNAKESKEI